MFGRKKKTEEESLQEQADALEKKIAQIKSKKVIPTAEVVKDNPIFQRAAKREEPQIEEPVEETVEEEPIEEEAAKTISKARIISCEVLENGLMKFTFISNIKMGELGQEFNL